MSKPAGRYLSWEIVLDGKTYGNRLKVDNTIKDYSSEYAKLVNALAKNLIDSYQTLKEMSHGDKEA